ncbi:MAG: metal-binding protein [Candidatus Accumulibacter sp. 66-26]|nr:MAG: metal-binding protein [Candidatus Accumulibacter sp. 66-26]
MQARAADMVDVYKSPYCGCCEKWVEHLQKNGFKVNALNVKDVPGMRKSLGMPERVGSCHTAKVGAYLIEGHVPAVDIQRLLKEKPKAVGLAAPGMPQGSPGMETATPVPYDTLLVQADGSTTVFAKH